MNIDSMETELVDEGQFMDAYDKLSEVGGQNNDPLHGSHKTITHEDPDRFNEDRLDCGKPDGNGITHRITINNDIDD